MVQDRVVLTVEYNVHRQPEHYNRQFETVYYDIGKNQYKKYEKGYLKSLQIKTGINVTMNDV